MEVNFYEIKQDACSRHFLWKLSRTFSFITYFGCGLVERVGVEKHFLGLGNPLCPCLVAFLVHRSRDDLEFSWNVHVKVSVSIAEC